MRYRLVLLLSLFAGACSGDGDRTRVTLRILHAVPDGPAIDVWVDGRPSRLYENVTFGTATGYISLEPGTYNFRVRLTTDPRSEPFLAESGEVDLSAGGGRTFTVILGGSANLPEPAPEDPPHEDALRLDVYEHAFADPAPGTARVRLVHNAPGDPTFDVALWDGFPGGDLPEGEFLGLARYTASDAEGLPVPAGESRQLRIADNATMAPLTSFTTPALEERRELFVVFIGTLRISPAETEGFAALVADADGNVATIRQNPRLYFLNAVADSTSVELGFRDLDEESMPVDPVYPLDVNMLYGTLGGDASASITVPPGSYEFVVRVTGDEFDLGAQTSPALAPAEQYLVTIGGRQDQTWPFELVFARDDLDRTNLGTMTENVWRFVHAAPDLQAVRLGEVVNNQFEALSPFPDAFDYATLSEPATGTDIGIDPFTLAIVSDDLETEFGRWDIVPLPDVYEFVVLLGSVEVVDQGPKLCFVDTTTQPWALSEQLPNGAVAAALRR